MMPKYYPQYPDAEDLQHSRVGTSSNPYSNPKSQALYDEAAREYRDMLMSQGHNYDPSGNRGSNTSPRPVLLSEDPDRYRGIRTCQVLPSKEGHADRAESEVYDDSPSASGKSSGGEQHRVDRCVIHYPVHVHLIIIAATLVLLGVSYCFWYGVAR